LLKWIFTGKRTILFFQKYIFQIEIIDRKVVKERLIQIRQKKMNLWSVNLILETSNKICRQKGTFVAASQLSLAFESRLTRNFEVSRKSGFK
jgi:hypothetical protein